MKKNCEVCGNEFEAKRVDARYCSAGCRVKVGRSVTDKLSVTDNHDISVTSVTDKPDVVTDKINVTRDDVFYANLTGPQAQELLKEACKIDPRINPIQKDWAAISGARIRRMKGLPKPYKPPKDMSGILDKLRAKVNQWNGVSAVRGAA